MRQRSATTAVLLAAAMAAAAGGCASGGSAETDSAAAAESAAAGADTGGGTAMASQGAANTLTDQERADGWRLLVDGATTDGWRAYKQPGMKGTWHVMDGALMKDGETEDIVSVDQFGDFELVMDWKVSRGANAGLFYRGTEEFEKIYWSAPEYQLLDDANHVDGRNRLTSAGASYGLYPAPEGVVKPAEQWNTTRLVVRGPHVEHWLNGTKLLEYELWSPDWEAKVKASKFNDWKGYGRAPRGPRAVQGAPNRPRARRHHKGWGRR